MQKLILLCTLYILCPISYGQIIQFTQTPAYSPLPFQIANFSQLGNSESDFIDIENDGDLDLILTGTTVFNNDRTELYINDGFGNYTIDTTENFSTVESGTIDIGDVDNDGDFDVLISGWLTGTLTKSTKLYLNDGNGLFIENTGLSLFGTWNSDPEFVDWDGDNDLDIFYSSSFPFSETRRYQNDGFGNFSLLNDPVFPSSQKNAFTFFDVDGDLDQDLLFSGQVTGSNFPYTKLYLNDGVGIYSPDTNTFVNVASGSISVGDIDGDLDLDVFISGIDEFGYKQAGVYRNDITLGSGFVQIDNLNPVDYSTSEFVDLNMDGNLDLIVGGLDTNNTYYTSAYINDGFGAFIESNLGLLDNIAYGDIDFADVNMDGSTDLFITGSATYGRSSFIYLNDGTGIFQKVSGTPFSGVQNGAISSFDIDDDSDKDVILSGWNLPMDSLVTMVYRNDGLGHFFLDSANNIIGKKNGDTDYSDVDGDGDLDFVISGRDFSNNKLIRFYKNDGFGIFNLDPLNLGYADFSALEFGDSQNDGWEDLLIAGGTGNPNTWIAQNNLGTFSGIPSVFSNSSNGDVSFGDADSDNDLDIFITGAGITKLYLNDGLGNYALSIGQPFTQLYNSSIEVADVDGDADLDMLQTGITSVSGSGNIICELYLNSGSGTFYIEPTFAIDGIQNGDLSLTDIDNDLDPDITILGYSMAGRITKIYQNQGGLSFVELANLPFDSLGAGSIAYEDFDLDGDLDLILTGQNQFLHSTAKLYENTSCFLSYGVDSVTTCSSYTTPSGNQTYTTIGSYVVNDTLVNACGADSIIEINLTLLPVQYNFDSINICYGSNFTYIDGSLSSNIIENEFHSSVLGGMASNGCDSVVIEYLIVPILEVNTTICQGSTFGLPDNSFIYNLNNDTIIETILSGLALGNCDSIVRTNIFVTNVDVVVNSNDSILNANTTSADYQWLECPQMSIIEEETESTFIAQTNGSYAVIINENGCLDTSDCVLITGLSISELIQDDVYLYPNPAESIVRIHGLEMLNEIGSIRVTNVHGIIVNIMIPNQSNELDLSNLKAGWYLIEIEHERGFKRMTLIKN